MWRSRLRAHWTKEVSIFSQKIKSNMNFKMTLLLVHKTYFSQYRLTASLLRSSLRAGSSASKPAFTLTMRLYSKVLHDVFAHNPFHVPFTCPTPPTSTRSSSSQTCRRVSGHPLAPEFLSCSNTCRKQSPDQSAVWSDWLQDGDAQVTYRCFLHVSC